ncbi:hypothetical protein [Ruegeria sp. ANG-S4]|uniref:hypothetical protein n=1 Tax=Ruegeria sp. ANG-S4 TaxID=1577904 RepID=UPI000A529E64|nr:hypothetical protein [Ruegeria sp. ANG-S4]
MDKVVIGKLEKLSMALAKAEGMAGLIRQKRADIEKKSFKLPPIKAAEAMKQVRKLLDQQHKVDMKVQKARAAYDKAVAEAVKKMS